MSANRKLAAGGQRRADPPELSPELRDAITAIETAQSGEVPTLTPITAEDFLALELKPREMVLAPWFPEKGLAMIHAPRGVGKTHVALNVAYAIAAGGSFLSWTAPQARKVLFVDGEMPGNVLQERLRAIAANADHKIETSSNLRFLVSDILPTGMPDLATPEGQVAFLAAVGDADAIILDNLSSLVRNGRDNDADSWTPMQDLLLHLRRAGKSVLLIHHSGKGGQQRGTSRKEDVLDTVIALKRPDDYDSAQGARFEVAYEKARGFFGDAAAPFEASLGEDGVWVPKELAAGREHRVRVLKNEGMSVRQIADELGIGKSTVSRILRKDGACG